MIDWLLCVADDLGWPLSTLNHPSFCIFMHLRNWRSQRRQIWCKGWMWKSQHTDDKPSLIWAWSGYVTHYKILGAPIISLERLNLKSSNFLHAYSYINSSNKMTYHNKREWLWSRRCLKKFAICCDAVCRAGLSATAELLVEFKMATTKSSDFRSLPKNDYVHHQVQIFGVHLN